MCVCLKPESTLTMQRAVAASRGMPALSRSRSWVYNWRGKTKLMRFMWCLAKTQICTFMWQGYVSLSLSLVFLFFSCYSWEAFYACSSDNCFLICTLNKFPFQLTTRKWTDFQGAQFNHMWHQHTHTHTHSRAHAVDIFHVCTLEREISKKCLASAPLPPPNFASPLWTLFPSSFWRCF